MLFFFVFFWGGPFADRRERERERERERQRERDRERERETEREREMQARISDNYLGNLLAKRIDGPH